MRFFCGIALVGLASLVATHHMAGEGWTPNREYKFSYSTQVVTGIPELDSQFSGVRVSSEVRVQSYSDSTLRIQMHDIKLKVHNDRLQQEEIWEMIDDSGEDIPSSMRGWLEAPFKVYHKNGLVEKIETQVDEPEFIVNMKKSLMSQLQLDTTNSGQAAVEQNQVQRGQSDDIPIFKTMETSILGECETIYSINKLPTYLIKEFEEEEQRNAERRGESSRDEKGESLCYDHDYYEIIKTKNLDNCKERPVFHNTFGLWSKSDGSMSSSVPSHSSVSRTIICGSTDSFVIRKSVIENEIQASAVGHKESKAKLEIKSTSILRLKSVGQVSENISEPSSPKSYPSLVFEYGNGWMSPESLRRQLSQTGRKGFAPMPGMNSSPAHPLPRSLSKDEIKEEIVSAIEDLVKDTKKLDEEVAGVSTVITRGLILLDYEQLKGIEHSLGSHQDSKLMKDAFVDLLAVTATNPCIKLLKEKIISGEISGETGSWVMAGALRAIRTPTGEVIRELTELLENHKVQECRAMESAIALSLSQLVHKACVNEESSSNEFPTRMYGKFCSEKSQEVEKLTSVLIQNLRKSNKQDESSMVIYVNALGNIGSEFSQKELLKVIEGEITDCPNIRSMAVYGLIKGSKWNPYLIRPILQTIIENIAENTQVRIAAITVLPFTQPTAADLQRLAVRTWYEPSKQVSAYIYSTIKSLRNGKTHPEGLSLGDLSGKASMALPLCKPISFQLQGSHNVQVSYFIDSLKTTVGSTLQVVSTEESLIPRSIFTKSTIEGVDVAFNTGEASLYMQGVESVIKQIYDMYSRSLEDKDEFQQKQEQKKNEREIRERSEKLNIVPRSEQKPEAHLIMKMLDMQKVYSLNAETISKLKQEMESLWSSGGILTREITKQYIKVQDLAGLDMVMPTESGIPAYFTRRSPVVSYMSAEMKPMSGRSTLRDLEFELKTILNYKREVQGGVITPLTNKAHGAGVDYSSFGALPLRGEVSYQHGQVSLTLKRQRDDDEHPMVEFKVRPFTTSCRVNRMKPAVKSHASKDISTGESKEKIKMKFGKHLGMDLELKFKSELDTVATLAELKKSAPEFWSSPLPMPFTRAEKQSIKLKYKGSDIEEGSVHIAIGLGHKANVAENTKQSFPEFSEETEIERVCRENAPRGQEESCREILKQKLQYTHTEVEQECQEEKQSYSATQERIQKDFKTQESQHHTEEERRDSKWFRSQSKIQEQAEEKLRTCRIEQQICKEEKELCERNEQTRSQSYCHRREEQCRQRRMVREVNSENLELLKKGNSVVAYMCTSLKKSGFSERIVSHSQISLAQEVQPTTEEYVINGKVAVESTKWNKPYKWSILSYVQNKLAKSIWSASQLAEEDVSSSAHVHSEYGIQGREEEVLFSGELKAFKSQEQKELARNSEWSRKCEEDLLEGRQLTENCGKARKQAVTVDEVVGTVSVSSDILQSSWGNDALTLAKGYLVPYLSVRSTGQEKEYGSIEYCMKGKLTHGGDWASLIISGNGKEAHLNNVRMWPFTKDLLLMCKRECAFNNFVQRITNFKTPKTCVLEAGKVKTFDRVVYEYELNDCEHVVFQDCSKDQRVSVSTRKTGTKQFVTAVVDGHKYQVEINKAGMYARAGKATVRVNGQEKKRVGLQDVQEEERLLEQQQSQDIQQRQNEHKEKLEFREGKNNYYNDKLTYITESKDGVMMIVSQKYGVAVLCDGNRLQIKSSEGLFRNKACGLCGDLNDEESTDLDSVKMCTMTNPRLAALSYMLEDGKCQGMSREEKSELTRQQHTCVKRVETPSKVMEVYSREQQQRPDRLQLRHLIQETGGKTCFSKRQVRSCSTTYPKEVRAQQIGFSCLARGKAGEILGRVKAGELIEELRNLPTNFSETVYEPARC